MWCGMAFADPALPECISNEKALKHWVEETIYDSPPVGGIVEMLKHWPPHYAKNDRVGEIWIVPAFIKVTVADGTFDHEMAFIAYHCDTKETTIEVLFGVKEDAVEKYLEAPVTDPKQHSI